MSTSKTVGERVRLVIADDNAQLRDKVLQLLTPEYEVVGAAGDGKAALEAISLLKPDIVLLDISMPIMNGIEVAAELKDSDERAKVVFLTVHEDPDFLRAALKVGASGYVVKSQMATDLTDALNEASAGRSFISPVLALTNGRAGVD